MVRGTLGTYACIDCTEKQGNQLQQRGSRLHPFSLSHHALGLTVALFCLFASLLVILSFHDFWIFLVCVCLCRCELCFHLHVWVDGLLIHPLSLIVVIVEGWRVRMPLFKTVVYAILANGSTAIVALPLFFIAWRNYARINGCIWNLDAADSESPVTARIEAEKGRLKSFSGDVAQPRRTFRADFAADAEALQAPAQAQDLEGDHRADVHAPRRAVLLALLFSSRRAS